VRSGAVVGAGCGRWSTRGASAPAPTWQDPTRPHRDSSPPLSVAAAASWGAAPS